MIVSGDSTVLETKLVSNKHKTKQNNKCFQHFKITITK